jgi:hypothetical protein
MCECDSMLHDDWFDIPCVVILRSFCFKPGMVSDKNTQRSIFAIISLCSFHKGIIAKGESSCYLPKVLVLGQKLVLGKPSNCALSWWSGFPSNTNLLCTCLKIYANNTMKSIIFMINKRVYNYLLKPLWRGSTRGLKILCDLL